MFDNVWNGYSSRYGIFAGPSRIAVHLVIRDDFPATPNEQRDKLEEELPFGERRPVELERYELLVEQHLPQFIKDFIAAEAQKQTATSETLKSRFKELMIKLGLRAPSPILEGNPVAGHETGDGELPVVPQLNVPEVDAPTPPTPEPQPCPPRPIPLPPSGNDMFGGGKPAAPISEKKLSTVPEVVWDTTSRDDNSTVGVIDANHARITLYEDHPLLDEVVKGVIETGVPKAYESRVRHEAREQIGYAAGRHYLVAQAALRRGWTREQRDKAICPEALTASIGFPDMHRLQVEVKFRSYKRRRVTKQRKA